MNHESKFRRLSAQFVLVLCVVACESAALLMAHGFEPAGHDAKNLEAREWPVFDPSQPREVPVPRPADFGGRVAAVSPRAVVSRAGFTSVQVNVDGDGNNIVGDAANEPTITVDVTNPSRMAIAWRQFDTVADSFRQAGMANTTDFGATWNARTLDPGQFRSDPVLGSDRDGNFYFSSLSSESSAELFRSLDGGATWLGPVDAYGGDKQWIAVDRTSGIGSGNIYQIWNSQFSCCGDTDFARSINAGQSFQYPRSMPTPKMQWGTIDVGLDGTVFMAGVGGAEHVFASSANAQNPNVLPTFSVPVGINLGGITVSGSGPNPGGLLGQVSIATDHSAGSTRGNIYVLGSVNPPGPDPLDVMFIRSTDGGQTWSTPVRVNDDPLSSLAYQWFGTMSVAPTGRIDAVWNDTRNDENASSSELFYSSSLDGGVTWTANVPITPPWDHNEGYPSQNKIGDYMHMVSYGGATHLAYAATFNDEQDVYYLRIAGDCNVNGVDDSADIANGTSLDCTGNGIPDECEPDCNRNAVADSCDILSGTSNDCTDNGLPDECESDCNGNGQPDLCETADGSTPDANNNSIPDECETVLYVRQGARGKQNGLNWTDAYDDLQAAFAHAAIPPRVVSGIWVAAGRYVPSTNDRSASFQLQDGLGIYGGFSGNETSKEQQNWHRNPTILSGDILGNDFPDRGGRGDNSFHVVECGGCQASILDGFIITGGYADGGLEDQDGAGVLMNGGKLLIQNCVIMDNHAVSRGGGVYVSDSSPGFVNSLIARNAAQEGAAMYSTRGSDIDLLGCTIAHNAASAVGAAAGDYSDNVLRSDGSIFWGNTDQSGSVEEAQIIGMSTVVIDYSTVEGWSGLYTGTKSSGEDPFFADADGADNLPATIDDNFRLTDISPAIDAGPIDPDFLLPADLDAHGRVLCGRIDRGAYEFGIGDFDCNRVVSFLDLGHFQACMDGPSGLPLPAGCEAFFFDADEDVDLIDFGLLLAFLSE